MPSASKDAFDDFARRAAQGSRVALSRRIFSDQLSPVLAYRRLVAADDRIAPSFLLESVEGGEAQGRYSFVGAQPAIEIVAHDHEITIDDHRRHTQTTETAADPLKRVQALASQENAAPHPDGPDAFCGGWVGYAGYDTVRWAEAAKLDRQSAPNDDRQLPDLHMALYDRVLVFDHVRKLVHVVVWADCQGASDLRALFDQTNAHLDQLVKQVQRPSVNLQAGAIDLELAEHGQPLTESNMTRAQFERAVETARDYIHAGDIFQVVLSQRFARTTSADPFDIYRALRIVNPSPYMIYLQARGSILVASSPEILCRVHDRTITNRPLAGTRRRGANAVEDRALEADLLADDKERAEHIMLVDLGRNDVGKVAAPGGVSLDRIMEIERYSHVMHISSTVTGRLHEHLTSWDALRAALPVGTVSGAPKIRAMQIIDELEPTRRGPYGGGIGVVSFDDQMDIALALRTMVIPTASHDATGQWTVHIQAGAGIVADSVPAKEYEETQNKAAALARAIDLAESAFRT